MAEKYVPRCEYCLNCTELVSSKEFFCKKHGIVPPDGSCRKFAYDPLKRAPKEHLDLPEFDASDFSLED